MKKFIILLISGSLALAATALAQPEDQQQNQQPKKSKKNQAEQTQAAGAANEATPAKQHGHAGRAGGYENTGSNANANSQATTNTGAVPSQNAAKRGGRKNREGKTNTGAAAMSPSPATGTAQGKGRSERSAHNKAATQSSSPTPGASGSTAAATQSNANAAPTPANANAGANVHANVSGQPIHGHGKGGKQLDQQMVQKVKTEHANFKAQARPDVAPAVTFNEHHRIEGAEHWQGQQYNVFRSYHAERHDHNWYHSHYGRVVLIGGGYYYWNNGYWFPAWGYDPGAEYYAYDGPIYVGHRAEPPDQVIADVQAILKEAGYYEGEVDGLLGPLTRQALTAYQADNGLYTTAAIDEPTLASLGLS
jgi:hypothetical protein